LSLLRKLVYENRLSLQDQELVKLSRYYIAHVFIAWTLEKIFGYADLERPFGKQGEMGIRVIKETALVAGEMM